MRVEGSIPPEGAIKTGSGCFRFFLSFFYDFTSVEFIITPKNALSRLDIVHIYTVYPFIFSYFYSESIRIFGMRTDDRFRPKGRGRNRWRIAFRIYLASTALLFLWKSYVVIDRG